MKNTVFLFFLFSCFCACKAPIFVEKKIVEFDTGFPINFNSYGTWYDKKAKKEYIYFGNTMTDSAIICFFTLDGQRQSEIADIPLRTNKGIAGLVEIRSIFVYDIDTVVILDKNYDYNQMVYLNRKGECFKRISFKDSIFIDTAKYVIMHSINQTSNKPFIYFRNYWNWTILQDPSFAFKNELEFYKMFYKKNYESPAVCKWNVQTNTYRFTAGNLIPKYFLPQRDTDFVFEAESLVLNENLQSRYANKLFLWQRAGNRILVLNPDNLQVECSFDVTSNYSPIGIPPFPLALRKQKLAENERRDGSISNILYDKNSNLYYIVTKHEIPEENVAFYSEAPFSIHTYNAKFEKLNEQYFEGGKYNYWRIFLTSQGLFIAQTENTNDYDPTKCRFYFYEIKK